MSLTNPSQNQLEGDTLEFTNVWQPISVEEAKEDGFDSSNIIISIRYFLVRFLSCPTPGLRNSIPIIGGRTVPELIVILGIPAVTIGYFIKGAVAPETLADYAGFVAVILGLRHNILGILFGISFERAVFYHKGVGLICFVFLLIHAIQKSAVSATGIAIATIIGLMALLYIGKNFLFELFYYFHIVGYVALIPITKLHGAFLIPYAATVWGADLAFRYVLTMHRIDAEVAILPGHVIKMRFKKVFRYKAGQYCFINISSIDPVQFHPFSLSSAPAADYTTFHIRALGDWTKKLETQVLNSTTKGIPWMPVKISVEGPFGIASIDMSKYRVS